MHSRSNARARVHVDGCTHVFAHEQMYEYEHPRTTSCRQERKRASTHARLSASLHEFVQTIMSSRIRTQSHYLIQTPIHCGTHPCKSVCMQPEGRRRKILAHGTRRLVAPLRHEAQRIGRGLRLSAVEHLHPARMRTACIEIYEPTTRIRLEGP